MVQQTPPRSLLQVRPGNQPDALAYAPQRDLAYIYPHAIREAFASLDKINWGDYFRGWLDIINITEDDLGEGVRRFCNAHKLFVGDRTIESPADALDREGFFDVPPPVRMLIYERLGEVITGGFFVALRDVTPLGDMPPQAKDIADFIAAGACISRRLHGNPPPAPDDCEQVMRSQAERLALAERGLRQHRDMLLSVNLKCLRLENDRNLQACRADKAELEVALFEVVQGGTFWQRLRAAWRLLWSRRICPPPIKN